jgi:hypothetical protein
VNGGGGPDGAPAHRFGGGNAKWTLRRRLGRPNWKAMEKPDLAGSRARRWTRAETYLEALARRGTERRRRRFHGRTEPEAPRLMLSTFPFVAMMLVLALLIVLFAVAAWPGSQPQFRDKPQARELGTAPRGWFEEAKKEFR